MSQVSGAQSAFGWYACRYRRCFDGHQFRATEGVRGAIRATLQHFTVLPERRAARRLSAGAVAEPARRWPDAVHGNCDSHGCLIV